jgi:hypothetical protein
MGHVRVGEALGVLPGRGTPPGVKTAYVVLLGKYAGMEKIVKNCFAWCSGYFSNIRFSTLFPSSAFNASANSRK